jgi:hypothetical protein
MEWMSEWESLADALERVTKRGTSRDEAKCKLCTDIAHNAIRVLPYVASETTGKPDVRLRHQGQCRVPPRLEPGDFDWENSRPFKPWSVNRTGLDHGWEDTSIKFVELNTDDVISRACGAASKIFKNPGGAPRKYDWDKFYIELIRLANLPDGLPEREDLNRLMIDWFSSNLDQHPDQSQIRQRLHEVFKALRKT